MPHCVTLLLVSCVILLSTPTAEGLQAPTPKQTGPTDQYGDPLPAGAIARMGSVRFHHQGGVIAAVFAPDGKTILAAGNEPEGLSLRFWDTSNGKERARIRLKGSDLSGLCFAPDGKSVFVGRGDAVEQYDCQSVKLLNRFKQTQLGYRSSAFAVSPDGKWLATNSEVEPNYTAVIQLWEIATGQPKISFKGQRGGFAKCQFSADSKRLLTASYSVQISSQNKTEKILGSVCVWEVTGKKLAQVANDDYEVALSSDGQTAAIQHQQSGDVRVVNVVTGKTVCAFALERGALEFTPDAKMLLTIDYYGNHPPRLWDLATGKELRRFRQLNSGPQRFANISGDGKLLAVLCGHWNQDGSIQFWDMATGEPLHRGSGHNDTVTAVAFAPNGKILASGSNDTSVRFWDVATGKELVRLEGHKGGITAVAFSRDGKFLASSSKDGITCLWDVAKRKELARDSGMGGGAAALVFSPDGKSLIAGGKSALLQVWDLGSFKPTFSMPTGQDGAVFALSGDGTLALSANGEERAEQTTEKLHLWKLPRGDQLLTVDLRKGERNYDHVVCWAAALSADGRWFAGSHSRASETLRGTMYADHTLGVWERTTGQPLLRINDTRTKALAFSPNGRLLASGQGNTLTFHNRSTDSRVLLWDLAAGKSIRVCQGHTNEAVCVAFSADGKLLASGSADHTILIWGDVHPAPLKPSVAKPSAKQLSQWWDDLKNTQASPREAITELLAHHDLTVSWMRELVKPAPPVDSTRIAQLVMSMNSSNFKERQKAIRALEALGELAEYKLRQVLASNPSLEVRKRAELLLAKAENMALAPEQVRMLRMMTLLEWIGTPDAVELLGTLAKGAPEARLTRYAQTTLARLRSGQTGAK